MSDSYIAIDIAKAVLIGSKMKVKCVKDVKIVFDPELPRDRYLLIEFEDGSSACIDNEFDLLSEEYSQELVPVEFLEHVQRLSPQPTNYSQVTASTVCAPGVSWAISKAPKQPGVSWAISNAPNPPPPAKLYFATKP